MRSTPTMLCALLAAGVSAAQAAETPAICIALHAVADAARQSGQPQRVYVGAGRPVCRAEDTVGQAFCETAAGADLDGFPWRLRACVDTVAADPQISFGGPHSGISHDKLITHLAAKLGHGVRMDLSGAAGGYDLVVWAPK